MALTRSGAVFTWGKGDYHRLGHGTDDHVRRPRRVAALQGKKVVAVATGSLHCVACTDQGETEVHCCAMSKLGEREGYLLKQAKCQEVPKARRRRGKKEALHLSQVPYPHFSILSLVYTGDKALEIELPKGFSKKIS